MRRAPYLLSLAMLVCAAATAFAQPENFSGHWVQEVLAGTRAGPSTDGTAPAAPRPAPTGSAVSSFGDNFLIVQDAKTLVVRRLDTTYGDTLSNTYTLDGSDSPNPGLFGGGKNPGPAVSTAKWNGKTLVITSNGAFIGGGTQTGVTTTTVWMTGSQMRIQSEHPSANGGSPTSILAIFNKVKK